MAELHAALTNLSPLPFADIPLADLPSFMRTHFAAGELIINSVPPPPHATSPFSTATPHHTRPNRANSAKEMHVSSVAPLTVASEHEELRGAWGKPIKLSAAQNPHGVALYKMAGKDRHGAWFARRSVHEGLGFERFCRAMKKEFPHSLGVKGGPGAGAIRGLAADVRLEEEAVEGLGKLEVYQLSGQMPKPVTPREFLQVIMTTEQGLSEKSGVEDAEGGGKKHVPRSYMIVSRPTTHEGAPERSGFVRGQYESVELIREVPLHRRHGASKSTSDLLNQGKKSSEHSRNRGATVGFAESRGPDAKGEQRDLGKVPEENGEEDLADPELNPVEWIMITRSDPGGGIPRFLVDRGTPDAMLGDVTKFLDWACKIDELPEDEPEQQEYDPAAPPKRAETIPAGAETANGHAEKEPEPRARSASESVQTEGGIVNTIANTVEAYAPTAVAATIHDYVHPTHAPVNATDADTSDDDDDESDTSSSASWQSATSMRRTSIAGGSAHAHQQPTDSTDRIAPPVASSESLTSSTAGARPRSSTSKHDKELQKLVREREKLDRRLAKKRAEEEAKINKIKEKEAADEEKAAEKHKKEISKAEEKHQKELKKLEDKERKEREKAENRRRKQEEKQKLSFVSRERDELRGQLEHSRKENELLLERIEELQRENTAMADKLGKLGGDGLLVDLRKSLDGGRGRAGSVKSGGSGEKKSLDGRGS